ncbi:hypothetical protein Bcop_1361 [Bacteroides coprosuis DSM 18011]|uniref:Lipoprotein n=1 Tax=Bacteroides coprosuis DSM 18011 TaxID=679937 RepID=F3ZNY2_9BACE|nr:RagB/SusD family nutrient uptake outer membrane protein [Bacteroides coprosuis]EGJ71558.1 hypothetical protein Bcop_1361 [Bacteroides coprosuis DSM 18011]
MKNIVYKIKSISAVALCALFAGACTSNFEDINQEYGRPNEDQISQGNFKLGAFFPQMINYAYPAQENAYQMGQNLVSDPYARYLSIANTWDTNFSIFNSPDNWLNVPFEDAYSKVYGGLIQVRNLTKDDPTKDFLWAWAQIIRITATQRMTDMYGPVPYTKALDGGVANEYDSQETVYKSMFTDLDNAIDVLGKFVKENPGYRDMARFDRVYASDFSKWLKYANSLKLRMAMRVVNADPELAKTKAEEALASEYGLIESNTENALNPFPVNPIWIMTVAWGDSRVSAEIISYMKGYNDPRLDKLFTKSSFKDKTSDFVGLRVGIKIPSKEWASSYSSTTYKEKDPVNWLTASEVAFIKAEAALRGWKVNGTPQNLYEEGVRLSFAQWNVDGSDAYLNDAESLPADYVDPNSKDNAAENKSEITVKWDESADFETKLERIITQKWLALYPLGMEGWSEHRRTGYPYFFPNVVNEGKDEDSKILYAERIPYPPREAQNNSANYNKALQLLGGPDRYGTKLWWAKK